jgi:hypothetical protein
LESGDDLDSQEKRTTRPNPLSSVILTSAPRADGGPYPLESGFRPPSLHRPMRGYIKALIELFRGTRPTRFLEGNAFYTLAV